MATLDQKRSEKRQRIINAALELFAENGFHATPVSLIAKTAGVGAGTIYRYFPSKEELIDELYKEVKGRMARHLYADFSLDLTTKENYFKLWESMVNFFVNYPKETAFLDLYSNTPLSTGSCNQEVEQLFDPLLGFTLRAQRQGKIAQVPPEIIWATLTGTVQALVKMSRMERMPLDSSTVRASFEFLWRSLQA